MASPKIRSENSDSTRFRHHQENGDENSCGARILDAINGRSLQWLSSETGIPLNTLRDYVKSGIVKTDYAVRIAQALDITTDWLLMGRPSPVLSTRETAGDGSLSGLIHIPALKVKACAGDGSFASGEALGDGPFQFKSAWLHQAFGHINSLRMIQITGDSQVPLLNDGDWVMIDEAKNKVENGLHVIRLDDCLMIKRLQREGNFLQLISANPIYAPTALDLSKEEDRLTVIGKAVYVFKNI